VPDSPVALSRRFVAPIGRHLPAFASLSAATQGEAVLSFLSVVVLVRTSDTVTAGQVFIAQALAAVWFMVLDPRLDDAAQRYVPLCLPASSGQATALFRRLLRLDGAIGLVAALLGTCLAALAYFYAAPGDIRWDFVTLALVSGGIAAASGTASAGFALVGQLRRLGLIRLGGAVVAFVLTVALTIVAGPIGYLWAVIFGHAGITAVLLVLASRSVRIAFGPPARALPLPRGIVRFALKSSAASSVAVGSDVGILALAGVLGGPALATFIKVASAPGRLFSSLTSPVSAQVYPRIAAAAASGNLAAVRSDIVRVSILLAGLGVAAAAVAYVSLDSALRIAYGDSYKFLGPTALVLFLGACLRGTVVWSKVLPSALGRPGVRLAFVVVESAMLVVCLVAATSLTEGPVDAALGFAWATASLAGVGVITWLVILRVLTRCSTIHKIAPVTGAPAATPKGARSDIGCSPMKDRATMVPRSNKMRVPPTGP